MSSRGAPLRAAALIAAGSNARGQLASGSCEDLHAFARCRFFGCGEGALPRDTVRVVDIACGANHTLLLLCRVVDGGETIELWGAGDGARGQLGPSYTTNVHELSGGLTSIFRPLDLKPQTFNLHDYKFKCVAAAWETSYVVLTHPHDGDVLLSMGANDFGDLGIGANVPIQGQHDVHLISFAHISAEIQAVDDKHVCVDHIAAGPHQVVVHVTFGACGGNPLSRTFCWGKLQSSCLDQLEILSQPPLANNLKPRTRTRLQYPHPFTFRPLSSAGEGTVQAAVGSQHFVCLTPSGRIVGCGSDRKSQLRGVLDVRHARSVHCTWNGTYAVVHDAAGGGARVLATGAGASGQLGRGAPPLHASPQSESPVGFPFLFSLSETAGTGRALRHLACGSEHVLALFSFPSPSLSSSSSSAAGPAAPATEVWAWGWNEHGNLGIGTTRDAHVPLRVWPQTGLAVAPPADADIAGWSAAGVWAGCGTSWIVLEG